jgi:hypothetical protein
LKVQVKEISHKGQSTLIEWVDDNDNLNRVVVPSTELLHEDGNVFVENPEEGAPHGEEWEDLLRAKYGPKGIADLLRRNGIWTYQDFLQNTAVVTSVFNTACSANLQQFREAVRLRQRTQSERNE